MVACFRWGLWCHLFCEAGRAACNSNLLQSRCISRRTLLCQCCSWNKASLGFCSHSQVHLFSCSILLISGLCFAGEITGLAFFEKDCLWLCFLWSAGWLLPAEPFPGQPGWAEHSFQVEGTASAWTDAWDFPEARNESQTRR